jgi:hypothetical protein
MAATLAISMEEFAITPLSQLDPTVSSNYSSTLVVTMPNPLDHIAHLSVPGELPRAVEQFKQLGFESVAL